MVYQRGPDAQTKVRCQMGVGIQFVDKTTTRPYTEIDKLALESNESQKNCDMLRLPMDFDENESFDCRPQSVTHDNTLLFLSRSVHYVESIVSTHIKIN